MKIVLKRSRYEDTVYVNGKFIASHYGSLSEAGVLNILIEAEVINLVDNRKEYSEDTFD